MDNKPYRSLKKGGMAQPCLDREQPEDFAMDGESSNPSHLRLFRGFVRSESCLALPEHRNHPTAGTHGMSLPRPSIVPYPILNTNWTRSHP